MKLNSLFEAVAIALYEGAKSPKSFPDDYYVKDIQIGFEAEFRQTTAGKDNPYIDPNSVDQIYEIENHPRFDRSLIENAYEEAKTSGWIYIGDHHFQHDYGEPLRYRVEDEARDEAREEVEGDEWEEWIENKAHQAAKEFILGTGERNSVYEALEYDVDHDVDVEISKAIELENDTRKDEALEQMEEEDPDEDDIEYEEVEDIEDVREEFTDSVIDWLEGHLQRIVEANRTDSVYEDFYDDYSEQIDENAYDRVDDLLEDDYDIEEFFDRNTEDIFEGLGINQEEEEQDEDAAIDYFSDKLNVQIVPDDGEGSGKQWMMGTEADALELISPVMPMQRAMRYLNAVMKIFRDGDFKTTDEEGLHINISMKNKKWEDYDVVKAVLFADEERVAKTFGRDQSHFTTPQARVFKQWLRRGFEHSGRLNLRTIKDTKELTKWAKSIEDDVFYSGINQSRFRGINIEKLKAKNYIEFRLMGNEDYDERWPEIKQTIFRYAWIIDLATSDKLDAEYRTKLSRLVHKYVDVDTEPTDVKMVATSGKAKERYLVRRNMNHLKRLSSTKMMSTTYKQAYPHNRFRGKADVDFGVFSVSNELRKSYNYVFYSLARQGTESIKQHFTQTGWSQRVHVMHACVAMFVYGVCTRRGHVWNQLIAHMLVQFGYDNEREIDKHFDHIGDILTDGELEDVDLNGVAEDFKNTMMPVIRGQGDLFG